MNRKALIFGLGSITSILFACTPLTSAEIQAACQNNLNQWAQATPGAVPGLCSGQDSDGNGYVSATATLTKDLDNPADDELVQLECGTLSPTTGELILGCRIAPEPGTVIYDD